MTSGNGLYNRIFGSGPLIAVAGAASISGAAVLAAASPGLAWPLPLAVRVGVLAAGVCLAAGVIAWSVLTLRPGRRGTELVTSGPFRFVRHPLYAACLTLLGPSLVIALAHPAYLAGLGCAYASAHFLIRHEEALMEEWFPASYAAYCQRVGRFVPRLPGRRVPS